MRFDASVTFGGRVYAILCQQDKRAKVMTVVVIVIADWRVSGKSKGDVRLEAEGVSKNRMLKRPKSLS